LGLVSQRAAAIRLLSVLALGLTVAACGKDSPTAPTPPPTPTRIIALEGNLNFGEIQIGQSFTATLRIRNNGTETLNITGMTSPNAGTAFSADWTNGNIPAGGSQVVTIKFTPPAAETYGGTLTVNGNQTSGTNTIQITGKGVYPPRPDFFKQGVGDSVFDMPPDVARVRIVGTYRGSSENFIVRIGGRLLVNEIIGRCCGLRETYDGTLLTGGGGVTEIRLSPGVEWSIREVR
jgi:hypothetical protein